MKKNLCVMMVLAGLFSSAAFAMKEPSRETQEHCSKVMSQCLASVDKKAPFVDKEISGYLCLAATDFCAKAQEAAE